MIIYDICEDIWNVFVTAVRKRGLKLRICATSNSASSKRIGLDTNMPKLKIADISKLQSQKESSLNNHHFAGGHWGIFLHPSFPIIFSTTPEKKKKSAWNLPETNLHPPSPLSNHHYRQAPGLSIFTLSHVVFIPGTDPGIIIPRATLYRGSHHIQPTHTT